MVQIQIIDSASAKWLGWSKNKLHGLALLREGREIILQKIYSPENGVYVQIRSSGFSSIPDLIRIWGVTSGFIFHPRNSTFPGGFTSDGDEILPVYGYPLVDDDKGSRLIAPTDGNGWDYNDDPPENYGNLDWIGIGGEVVSWRGPASRSFAMDSLNSYPGFTIVDYVTELTGEEHFTPYGYKVYQSGDTLFEFPNTSKVLGATDTYVVLGVDYAGRENPDGETGGFYTEVWLGDSERIGYLRDSRPSVPWFFNQEGNEAVSNGRKLQIIGSVDAQAVEFSELLVGSGSQTKHMLQGPTTSWGLNRNGNWPMFHDYDLNSLSKIDLSLTDSQLTTRPVSGDTELVDLPIKISGTPAEYLIISGPDAYTPGAYTAIAYPSGAGCEAGEIVWTMPTGCGMGTVTATRSDGISGSKQVRMPTGVWVEDLGQAYLDTNVTAADKSNTLIVGNTKITETCQYNGGGYQTPVYGVYIAYWQDAGGSWHCSDLNAVGYSYVTSYTYSGGRESMFEVADLVILREAGCSPLEPTCCWAENSYTPRYIVRAYNVYTWECP